MQKKQSKEYKNFLKSARQSVYNDHGCCLHIVIADGNIEDRHLEKCLANAVKDSCNECQEMGPSGISGNKWRSRNRSVVSN